MCIRIAHFRCVVAPARRHGPKPSPKPISTNKPGGTTVGNVFEEISQGSANVGLGLDFVAGVEASTGIGLEPAVETFGLSSVVNTASTVTGCAADYFNGGAIRSVVAGCGEQVAVQFATESKAGGGLVHEVGKWYGDVTTAIWDLHRLPF